MSAKTKIVVFRMKELIYTAVFVGLGILLIVLLVSMFAGRGRQDTPTDSAASYTPGVYSASLVLNNQNVDLAVTVDADHINSIYFTNLSEDVATMYPLMEPALENLTRQILENQSTDNIQNSDSMKYTETALLQAIEKALEQAAVN